MLDDPLVQDLLKKIIDDPMEEDSNNIEIVRCLNDGITTDEEIAEKTGIRLNIVRKILYKLYDGGLASYKRYKDPETQWFSYNWQFEPEEVNNTLKKHIHDEIEEYEKILNDEKNNMFFVCPQGHNRFDFEDASNNDFICPECGEEVIFETNEDFIESLEKKIDSLHEKYDSIGN